MVTTIIFDLDGTLMNTLDDLHASVSYALESEGLTPCNIMDTRRFLGNGVKNLIFKSVEHTAPGTDEATKERILNSFRAYYMEHSMDKTAPYEGISELLTECRNRGYYTAIVSNKLDPAVKELHKSFFADTIDIAIGETPTVRRKPAPDMVHEALRQLSSLHVREIKKEECVYVGDSEVDVATAINSALRCIAVSWGFRDRDVLIDSGATTIIDHPSELLSAI